MLRNPLWAQMIAIDAIILAYMLAQLAGFHPWPWLPGVAGAWGAGIMVACTVDCVRMRRAERRWNEELHRLMEFNRMLAEERRSRKAAS